MNVQDSEIEIWFPGKFREDEKVTSIFRRGKDRFLWFLVGKCRPDVDNQLSFNIERIS
jgi:hypothetical protein